MIQINHDLIINYCYEERAAFITHIKPKTHLRKKLPRSSYAFAQQEGWGPLITSGRMQVKRLTEMLELDMMLMYYIFFHFISFLPKFFF